MSAVSVSEITAPFRPLLDYSSLSPYALSAITLPFRLTLSLRLLFPFALRSLCDYCSLSPYALSVMTLPFRPTPSLRLLFPSTKTPILCSRGGKTWEKLLFLTQKPRFCARADGELALGSVKWPSCKSPRTL